VVSQELSGRASMTLEAITFTLNSLETGRRLGSAVVCPGGRYASVWWQGTPRPDRRHASPKAWREIEGELSVGLPPGPLESRSAFAEVIVPPDRWKSITLRYVARVPVATEPITAFEKRLDRLL
jgi:hypothetical protein